MAYVAADDSGRRSEEKFLCDELRLDLSRVRGLSRTRVSILLDRIPNHDEGSIADVPTSWTEARLLSLTRRGTLQDHGRLPGLEHADGDMGSSDTLARFVAESFRRHGRGDARVLVLAGHGREGMRICLDATDDRMGLTLAEIDDAFRSIAPSHGCEQPHFDLVVSYACCMATLEAAELASRWADVYVASEDDVDTSEGGFDCGVVADLERGPGVTEFVVGPRPSSSRQLAVGLAPAYLAWPAPNTQDRKTMSAVWVAAPAFRRLVESVEALGSTLRRAMEGAHAMDVAMELGCAAGRCEWLSAENPQPIVDLDQLMTYLIDRMPNLPPDVGDPIAAAAKRVQADIPGAVDRWNGSPGRALCGLSIVLQKRPLRPVVDLHSECRVLPEWDGMLRRFCELRCGPTLPLRRFVAPAAHAIPGREWRAIPSGEFCRVPLRSWLLIASGSPPTARATVPLVRWVPDAANGTALHFRWDGRVPRVTEESGGIGATFPWVTAQFLVPGSDRFSGGLAVEVALAGTDEWSPGLIQVDATLSSTDLMMVTPARARIVRVLDLSGPNPLPFDLRAQDRIRPRVVTDLDPNLAWEFGPTPTDAPTLTIGPRGIAGLRLSFEPVAGADEVQILLPPRAEDWTVERRAAIESEEWIPVEMR